MHPPEAHTPAPRSLREFLRAYAMIVLSIVTALALERAAVAWQNRNEAAASRARIENELALNLAELKQSIAANQAATTTVQDIAGKVIDALIANTHDDKTIVALLGHRSALGISLPTWRRDAWEAAIADQSASHMPPKDLRRYTEIYSGARDLADVERYSLGSDFVQSVAEMQLSLRLGHPDPHFLASLMLRFQIAASQILTTQQSLLTAATKP